MDKFDILEAMSGIRDEYIEEAAVFPMEAEQELQDLQEQKSADDLRETEAAVEPKKKSAKILHMSRWATTAAAVVCVCLIAALVSTSQRSRTLSDSADAQPGVAVMYEDQTEEEGKAYTEESEDVVSFQDGSQMDGGTAQEDLQEAGDAEPAAQESGYYSDEDMKDVSAVTAMSEVGVSGKVRELAEEEIRVFEDSLAQETGYPSLRFTHEVTTDSEEWFSLKMLAYTSPADGFEQVTHFNISRKDGEYVTLETLFDEETDYITPLSKEVIRQMREQMAANPDVEFWLDSAGGQGYDFVEISPAQDFYFDKDGNLVLCFNEGEAAPMYMGTVEFTIPDEITEKLLEL